uniref:Putative GIY-YIG homing endonuclease n=1 Tax=Hazenia capsulata TaxID=2202518 RepID=A0A1W6EHJ7_9CHLO|nr:putative GIY-YIG homing endonuclease [Hazenia capsulata]ARK14894.1 putative GIY-YIG homing endonuclease [Hazenia capsulata]
MKIINLSFLVAPGIYKIFCLENNKTYIGESSNILSRLGRHSDELLKNKHDCLELQKDYNQYGKEAFLFYAFDLNPELIIKQKRKLKEISYIQEIHPLLSYNKQQTPKKKFFESHKVLINGSVYPSLRQAAKQIGESRTNRMRKIKDLKNLDYQHLEIVSSKKHYKKRSMPCSIDNVHYLSLSDAAKELKQSPTTIKKKCQSSDFPNFIFLT